MLRSMLLEVRGSLTLLALIIAALISLGLTGIDDPILMILANLRIHAAIALVVVSLVLLVFHAWFRGIAFAIAGVATITLTAISLAPHSTTPTGGVAALKVLSFNILTGNNQNGARIADYLVESGADVAFIQESGPLVSHRAELAKSFPYQAGCGQRKARCGDVLILSKRPLERVRISELAHGSVHQSITADISVEGQTVHLYAIHLVRPYDGFTQAHELASIGRKLAALEGPVILAGDFNAATWLQPFTRMLGQAGLKRARFEPGTWPVPLGDFGQPIDHILVKPPAQISWISALPDNFGSNHRGLMAGIALGKGTE